MEEIESTMKNVVTSCYLDGAKHAIRLILLGVERGLSFPESINCLLNSIENSKDIPL